FCSGCIGTYPLRRLECGGSTPLWVYGSLDLGTVRRHPESHTPTAASSRRTPNSQRTEQLIDAEQPPPRVTGPAAAVGLEGVLRDREVLRSRPPHHVARIDVAQGDAEPGVVAGALQQVVVQAAGGQRLDDDGLVVVRSDAERAGDDGVPGRIHDDAVA